MLTRSASERRGIACKSKLGEQHKKQLRRYFLLCLVMFCVDDRCSLPMHVLLADLIDSQGGTAFLIHALNKLGICSSLDTLQRHIQSIRLIQQRGIRAVAFFNSSTFTVVSADNIDFLHSFARVFKGGSNSSWHGTTVQLVQPLPGIEPVQLSQGPVQLSQGSAELGQGPAQFGQGPAQLGQKPVQLGQQSAQLDQGSVQLDQGSVQLGQQSAQLG